MELNFLFSTTTQIGLLLVSIVGGTIPNSIGALVVKNAPEIVLNVEENSLAAAASMQAEADTNYIKSFFIKSQNPLNNYKVEVTLANGEVKEVELTAPEEFREEHVEGGNFYESQLIGNMGKIQDVNVIGMDKSQYEIIARIDETNVITKAHGYGNVEFEKQYKRDFYTKLGISNIVLREEWGAPTYSNWWSWIVPVDKFVIHHTAFGVNMDDTSETVRDIYFEHANRCSPYVPNCEELWDDIGYNYLIDPYGRIYEGRSGGNGVVAAHSPPNDGTIGIGLMGNFHNSETPTPQAINTLVDLMARLSALNGIEPIWEQTVFGHRHRQNTSCPGDTFYGMLPTITQNSAAKKIQMKSILDLRKQFEVIQLDVEGELSTIEVNGFNSLTQLQKEKIWSMTRNEVKLFYKNNNIFITLPTSIAKQYIIELELLYPMLDFMKGEQLLSLPDF